MMQMTLFVSLLFLITGVVHSADLNDVLGATDKKLEAAQSSQKKIDGLADDTRNIVEEYRVSSKIVDDLKVYNRKLEIQIEKQTDRLAQIEQSIANVKVIQRQIIPQVMKMIDTLDDFVRLDIPFHKEEREQRVAFLRSNIDRPDLSVAEKFRQVLEAYKIENEYGRKIDTYTDTIAVVGAGAGKDVDVEREVSILRVGRIALLYQTFDKEYSGMWNQQLRQWVALNASEYRDAIRQGLRIASKQTSIDILELPILTSELEVAQ